MSSTGKASLPRLKTFAGAAVDREKSLSVRPAVCPKPPAYLIVSLIRLNCFLARSRENDITRNPTKGYGHAARLIARARETLLLILP